VPIYALGVTLGISRKRKEEPGRIGDNRLNRPAKLPWGRIIGKYGRLSSFGCVYQDSAVLLPTCPRLARRCQEIGTERRQSACAKSFTTI